MVADDAKRYSISVVVWQIVTLESYSREPIERVMVLSGAAQ